MIACEMIQQISYLSYPDKQEGLMRVGCDSGIGFAHELHTGCTQQGWDDVLV